MISVVIPLYNKVGSIGSTVESVLSQTYGDFELIVVDDGSSDGSPEVVGLFADSRIRLISKPNGGVCSARNAGIAAAKSEYVAFLDADDLWLPQFLEEIVRLMEDCPEAGIWGTSYYLQKDGQRTSAAKPLPAGYRGIVDNSGWTCAHIYCSSAVCCRKSALVEAGLFDERMSYGEDLDMWWRIMLRHPAAYLNAECAVYRHDEDNRAMSRRIPLEKLHVRYLEKYSAERAADPAFRHFIDMECMWWLYPYFLSDPKNPEIRRILAQIDLSEYKKSFRLRFKLPHLYRVYTLCRRK